MTNSNFTDSKFLHQHFFFYTQVKAQLCFNTIPRISFLKNCEYNTVKLEYQILKVIFSSMNENFVESYQLFTTHVFIFV